MQLRSGVNILIGNPPATSDSGKRERLSPALSEHSYKRARLTARNLRLHNGYQAEVMGEKAPTTIKSSSTKITTSSTRFPLQLEINGVVDRRTLALAPDDVENVKTYLDRRRASASPPESEWQAFSRDLELIDNEEGVRYLFVSHMMKPHPLGSQYRAVHNMAWPNSSAVKTGFTDRISPPKPDYHEAHRLGNYPTHAIDALGGHLAPSAHLGAMAVFAAEVKSTEFTLERAKHQCAYDGAVMASAAQAMRRYLGQPVSLKKTEAVTAAYNGVDLNLHAHHLVQKSNTFQEAHCYELWKLRPGDSYQDYCDSYRRVRNSQDWAYERATQTLKDLNAFVPAAPIYSVTPSISTGSASAELAESSDVSIMMPSPLPWVWSAEKQNYYCVLPNNTIFWKPISVTDVIPPPSKRRKACRS